MITLEVHQVDEGIEDGTAIIRFTDGSSFFLATADQLPSDIQAGDTIHVLTEETN